jgi:hypothetical protein
MRTAFYENADSASRTFIFTTLPPSLTPAARLRLGILYSWDHLNFVFVGPDQMICSVDVSSGADDFREPSCGRLC